MKVLLFFIFCTLSVYAQPEPKVIIFYEYTADGYALFAANEEEYPVTIVFDFDLFNLKVVREGPSAIVVPAEIKKHKLVDLVAINVLKGYSFEYTYTVKKGAIKTNLLDIIAAADTIPANSKDIAKVDNDETFSRKLSKKELRDRSIEKNVSNSSATTIESDPSVKTIAKTEPTQVAIAKTVKKRERERKKKERKDRSRKKLDVESKSEPIAVVKGSDIPEIKDPAVKTGIPKATIVPVLVETKPIATTKPIVSKVDKPIVETKPVVLSKPVIAKEDKSVVSEIEPVVTTTKPAISRVDEPDVETKPVVMAKPVVFEIDEPIIEETKSNLITEPVIPETKTVLTGKPIVSKVDTSVVVEKKPVENDPKVLTKEEQIEEEKSPIEYAITGKYDAAFQYHLPFVKGQRYVVSQGYRGSISHQTKFAVDFDMKHGTAIYSARGGMVLEVVSKNTEGCGTENCDEFDNFIVIMHPDGSFAKYGHLEANGASVAEGDTIEVGQLIGQSGSTGWTSSPALHFEVFVQKGKEQKTIKTNFLIGDGSDYTILMEQRWYKREY